MMAFAWVIMSGGAVHAGNGMLEITSQTKKPSADCVIKKLNVKKDKARKEIGIGEIVELTLAFKGGKPLNKNTRVTWTKKGKGAKLKGAKTQATLTADLIMEDNSVTVTAKADDFPPAEITFNIKKPTLLTGEKGKKETEYRRVTDAGFGVYGEIIVTVHPTSVSFAKCGVIEKDGGTVLDPKAKPPFKVKDHDPGNDGRPPDNRNEFTDHVQLAYLFNTIAKLNGTCRWAWLCNYEVTQLKKRIEQIQQIFTITRTNRPGFPNQKNCSGTVSKFGVSFSIKSVEQIQ